MSETRPQVESKGSGEYPNKPEQAADGPSLIAPPSTHSADRPTLARVPRYTLDLKGRLVYAGTEPTMKAAFVPQAEYDALAQQLQQAQEEISLHCHEQELAAEELDHIVADRDRWALNYNRAQADLARARGSYEADILRLTGERDEARSLSGAVGRLAIWTQHQSTCARVTEAGACSCGLQDAWTDLEVLLHPK
jgi:hypothetical protein